MKLNSDWLVLRSLKVNYGAIRSDSLVRQNFFLIVLQQFGKINNSLLELPYSSFGRYSGTLRKFLSF